MARLALVLLTLIPLARAEHLPIKTYSVADGLVRDNDSKVRQDSRGFMWFCTSDGISRFDGYAFASFTMAEGLPDRHVNDFLETRSGAIYLSTNAGIARLNPTGLASSEDNPLFKVILPADPKTKLFTVLFQDDRGEIWAGSERGLYKLNGQDELESFDLGPAQTGTPEIKINDMIQDRRGALWLATEDNGLFRILPNRAVEQFNMSDGLPDTGVSTLIEDRNGRLWVGLRQHYVAGLLLLVAEPRDGENILEEL